MIDSVVSQPKSAKDKLDGVRIVGAQPFAAFQAAIEGLLKTEVAMRIEFPGRLCRLACWTPPGGGAASQCGAE